uniref:Uncharacterized protein n=1 Tax=Ralstonia solanacearum TaxID=305 RepID=A0A0S4WU51_RALSL|nr:protein of unknown function [Ralstonia solanacearum]
MRKPYVVQIVMQSLDLLRKRNL